MATSRSSSLSSFLNDAGESLVLLINGICTRLEAHDEHTTFLACSRKSRQAYLLLLSTRNDKTARGLKTTIA
jgi:hypothetical protein